MAPPATPRLPRDVRCSKAAQRCVRKEVTSETVKVLNTETYDRSMGGGDCLTYHPRGDTPETDGGRHAGRRRPPDARRSCPGIRRAGRWQRQGHGRVRKAAVRGTWSRRRHRACHRTGQSPGLGALPECRARSPSDWPGPGSSARPTTWRRSVWARRPEAARGWDAGAPDPGRRRWPACAPGPGPAERGR